MVGRSLLVLDFDGTVCLGDDAPLAYARELAGHAGGSSIEADLRAFLDDPDADPGLREADDGYQAVALLAAAAGIPAEARDAAYRASRDRLDPATLRAPEGLRDFLADVDARRVLCTNAPGRRLQPLLESLGLAEVIDYVLPDARKPGLMAAHLTKLLDAAGLNAHPEHLMSVGDIWANDLRPALEVGCATAYVDTFDRRRGPAHARDATMTGLYADISAWTDDPRGFIATRPLDAAGIEDPVLDSTPTGPGQP